MIDITFDFTTDSKGYWDGFWERGDGLGVGGSDPDKASATLRTYHQQLWSKHLPNGETMKLEKGKLADYDYLTWKNMRFGSDSVIVSFRYYNYRYIIDQVFETKSNYKGFYEALIRKAYTIGGMLIFPKHQNSMNQSKGTNRKIADRLDLTLECIRLYYLRKESPLYKTIERDKEFFDLFIDFKGYIDFFLLQDAVSEDYKSVNIWDGKGDFIEDGLPKTLEAYYSFLDKEFDFLEKRNKRIEEYSTRYGL